MPPCGLLQPGAGMGRGLDGGISSCLRMEGRGAGGEGGESESEGSREPLRGGADREGNLPVITHQLRKQQPGRGLRVGLALWGGGGAGSCSSSPKPSLAGVTVKWGGVEEPGVGTELPPDPEVGGWGPGLQGLLFLRPRETLELPTPILAWGGGARKAPCGRAGRHLGEN